MKDGLVQYFRCPDRYVRFAPKGSLSASSGYFQFGAEAVCYGSYCGHQAVASTAMTLHDALCDVVIKDQTVYLPFDPSQVARNLRCEMYTDEWSGSTVSALAKLYYFIRPMLSAGVRRQIQKLHFTGWDKLTFPRWPVDCSVDSLHEQLLLLSLKSNDEERIPFIWFWPDGAPSCAIMTHDVETQLGRDFCPTLMDCNDSFGIKASFEIVPEERYSVSRDFLDSIRTRGFEIVVHDLNHDGNLFRDRKEFLERAAKINSYAREYGAEGFRAAILFRKQSWFDALEFSYDMSVPNVAHLDPIDLWKRQIEIITRKHGLISFIVHPDYIGESRKRSIYAGLLAHLIRLKKESLVWITTPGEVNRWWRQRAEMTLVENGNDWRIEGPGSERARIAYASEKEGQLVYALQAGATQRILSTI